MDVLHPSAKGKRNLVNILDAWADRRPEKVHLSLLNNSDVQQGFRDITHREVRDAADAFAWWLYDTYGKNNSFETIAYIGTNDVRYLIVFYGAIKAGYKALFVSPRNPATTNASLLEQTKCTRFLHSGEMASAAVAVQKIIPTVETAEIAPFDHWSRLFSKPFVYEKSFEDSKWDPILVLHSSGSTGLPKPITLNIGYIAAVDADLQSIPGRSVGGVAVFSFDGGGAYFSPFPLFHLAGVQAHIYQPVLALEASSVLGLPDRPPTPQLILDIIEYRKVKALYSPPSIIEMISQLPGGFESLCACEYIIYAGGPLSSACGDRLTQNVTLSTVYGSTETGANHMLMPLPEDWDYIEFHPDFHVRMEQAVEGASELVFSQGDPKPELRAISWSLPNSHTYRTRDMFLPHPSKAGLWKFFGRNDDIIVFANGAKYNPMPAENTILGSDLVAGVLVLGDGRMQTAALVEPKAEQSSTGHFIDELWPLIEQANARSQRQGHIVRSKIAIVPCGGLIRAPKGTVVRKLTCEKFRSLIENLYSDQTDSTDPSRGPTLADTGDNLSYAMLKFVRECSQSIHGMADINDEDDFYVRGMDSVQTAEFVRILRTGLRPRYRDTRWLNGQVVFDHPNVRNLAAALEQGVRSDSTNGTIDSRITSRSTLIHVMQTMTARYQRQILEAGKRAPEKASLSNPSKLNVLLTGSTGSLGMRILKSLTSDAAVESCTCLDRSDNAQSRIESSMGPMNTSKVRFLQGQVSEKNLGLSDPDLASLQNADIIIHNAWKVDFNHSLPSFEAHIAGVSNLLQFTFSLSRRARLIFISSTSSTSNWIAPSPVPEAVIADPTVAANMGYAQSKHVAETLLAHATHNSPAAIPLTILRVGQIGGPIDDGNGPAWNPTEWFPSLLRTAQALRVLPHNLPPADWIPVDRLGRIVAEVATESIPTALSAEPEVYNLVNPATTPWGALMEVAQARWGGAKACGLVSLAQWIELLKGVADEDDGKNAAATLDRYPALKLVPFFESLERKRRNGEAVEWTVDKASRVSRTFADLEAVRPEWLRLWMDQWGL